MGTPAFSVIPPNGKGWSIAISPDSQAVQFKHVKKGVLDLSTPEETTIKVFLNFTTPENALRGADSVAKDFIDQEEAQLRHSFQKDLKNVRRGTDTIGPYHLYLFEPTIQLNTPQGYVQSDQQLFIYFPPDFEVRCQFFLFHIQKVHPPKNLLEKRSLGDIRPVIESFRDERPPLPAFGLFPRGALPGAA